MMAILKSEIVPSTLVTFRPGSVEDSYTVFYLFEETLADLFRQLGLKERTSWSDPVAMEKMWQERRSLYEHLARTADQFWLAEREGEVIGFARSTLRDGVQELTEFFIRPDDQSAGIGRELLARAFPEAGAEYRSIIATTLPGAQIRYLKAGVYPRFPIYYFGRKPELVDIATDLEFEPGSNVPGTLATLGALDETILAHRRDVDHYWLLSNRQGYVYYRDGQPVGYGYVGLRSGPFALLDAGDFPAVLVRAESELARQGYQHFGLEVPMINQTVVDYVLARGFRMDPFVALYMSDRPFGKFENYLVTSPPFIL